MKENQRASKKVIIIGGGISGLASAALLAKQGLDVTLLEKNTTLGGRARVLQKKGFTFDMGPSWYMMPEVFEKFFSLFGKKTSDYYELIRLDPRYTVYFEKDQKVTLTDNIDQNSEIFEKIEIGAGKQLRLFLKNSQKKYETVVNHLIYLDIWDWKTVIKPKNLWGVFSFLFVSRFWESWYAELSRYFSNEKLKKILGFPASFLGGSPFNSPSLYSILAWADFGKGIWYPKGGMGKVISALEKLAKEQGAVIVTNSEVKKINVDNGKVVSVKTKDKTYVSDIIVAATDIPFVETQLLDKEYQTYDSEYWNKKTISISSMLLYLGVKKPIKNITHHSIYFSDDWKNNFDELFTAVTLPKKPSLYISVRSKSDTSIVPKNYEEIVVLVPLGSRTDYSEIQLKKFSEKIILQIEKILKTNIKDSLVVNEMFGPRDFANDYNAYKGTALGLAHTIDQSLWFRPQNKSKKVENLYYAGQFTNPGVGMPIALISAQLVAQMIDKSKEENDSIFKKGSVTYYNSSLFFKGQTKKDVFSLYAFVRVMDDFVDIPVPNIKAFKQMCEATKIEWNGGNGKDRVVRQFIELAKRKNFKWQWIEAFMDAMKSDLTKKHYATFEELEKYMYGSAEVVGFMMAKILDLSDGAQKYAGLQGKAMQYINFIRDVKEDEALGRNYLSYSDTQKMNQALWHKMIRKCIEHYWQIQSEAEKGYKFIPKRYLVPIKTASDMYGWTATQIYADPSVVWQKPVKPGRFRVIYQLVKNVIIL